MSKRNWPSDQGYGGYFHTDRPTEDAELTHVDPGTPGGEYLRRFWQPVALAREVDDMPLRVSLLGEDLVLFRDGGGRWGLVHRNCVHRRAPLEYARPEERGLRCCYHGWLFDVDGTLLEAPLEPSDSKLPGSLCQPAYPVHEHRGLIFAYLGPPAERPPFPIFDTYEIPGGEMVPFAIDIECNWLQITENSIDPAHTVYLHTRSYGTQFFDSWGEAPLLEFHERDLGFMFTSTRRVGDHVWVRSQDLLLPNMTQGGTVSTGDGKALRAFARSGYTRWQVPLDTTHTRIMGWRHFNDISDPFEAGLDDPAVIEAQEIGEIRARPWEERRRNPGDYEIFLGLGPVSVHAKERLASTDRGVAMLRRKLRKGIRALATGDTPPRPGEGGARPIASFGGDTVVLAPRRENGGDDALLREIAAEVTRLYLTTIDRPLTERRRIVAEALGLG